MENLLYTLVREHRSLELGIGTVERFKRALKAFNVELDNASDADKAYLLDVHYEVLSKVKRFITTQYKGDALLKRLHEEVFVTKLNLPLDRTPTVVTRLFEEFVKGITYFRYQNDPSNPVPIYHRFFSCGVGTEVYRGDNLICDATLTIHERRRRRPLIERCYLERLIYDALYRAETLHFPKTGTNATVSQDKGHMFRLDLTRKDYETCFKGQSIEVFINYNGKFPLSLRIIRKKNDKLMYEEQYTHELRSGNTVIAPYTGIVTCKKTMPDGRVYMKTQDFTSADSWHLYTGDQR